MRRQIIFCALGLALIGAASLSATPLPQPIDEDLQHGQQITILGSDFGSKSQAAPWVYDDFEDGTIGETPGNGWYIHDEDHPEWYPRAFPTHYSSDVQRFPGGISVKQGEEGGAEFARTGFPDGGNNQMYISAWFWGTENAGSQSNKFMQLNHDWSPPQWRIGGDHNNYRSKVYDCNLDQVGPTDWFTRPFDDEWHHWEFYFQWGGSGEAKIWRDGDLEVDLSGDFTLQGCDMSWIFFNSYWGQWTDGREKAYFTSYWDEIYIDTTRARVEIGNASTYGACNHREIQIPIAWSPNSISFTVNKGSFSDGTAYLYVIDQDGSVNQNGIQVTLGGGGGGVDNPPGIQILTPVTGGDDYPIPDTVGTLVITGTANDDHGIAEITWSNDRTLESGQVNNQSGNWTIWQLQGIGLETGVNTIEIQVRDSSNQTTTETITVTRDWEYPAKPETPRIP